jgi:hypothetical protein
LLAEWICNHAVDSNTRRPALKQEMNRLCVGGVRLALEFIDAWES